MINLNWLSQTMLIGFWVLHAVQLNLKGSEAFSFYIFSLKYSIYEYNSYEYIIRDWPVKKKKKENIYSISPEKN